MESKTVHVKSLKMRWEEAGEGPAVVFLHGLPTSPAVWRHVIPQITGARCLAWEMVGYGGSIGMGYGRDLSVARQVDYLIEWMDAIGLDDAILVGHDLGGGVAQIAAVHHPTRVRGLVLANAISYDSWPVPIVKILRALSPFMAFLPDIVFQLFFLLFLYRSHDDGEKAQEAFHVHWPYYAYADGAAAFVRQIEALDVNDTLAVADRLSELDLPARIVWGTDDGFLDLRYGERLARDLKAPLDRIEGAKHFVPEDHPERVAAAVQALVDAAA